MITAAELSAIPLFADLTPEQLAFLARAVEDIPLLPGEYAVHEGDERALFVVVDGRVDLTKEVNGVERVIGPRGPGEIYGEVPVMLSMNMPAELRGGRGVADDQGGRRDVLHARRHGTAGRRTRGCAGAGPHGGPQGDRRREADAGHGRRRPARGPARARAMRTFLHRNRIAFETARRTATASSSSAPTAPGSSTPTVREIALAGGLRVVPARDEYDVVIVGGGPTGLTAAVNGAAEGLRTLVVEKFAPGGQAGTSTRIENYTGFPFGVSGDELASKALRQAERLGRGDRRDAVGRARGSRTPHGDARRRRPGRRQGRAADLGRRVAARRRWRRSTASSATASTTAPRAATPGWRTARTSYIIGAGNSAGQAALFFSRFARSVTLVVRGESLAASMSQYLIDQIGSNRHVTVETRSEVVALHGQDVLERIEVVDRRTGTVVTHEAEVLFVMIGADAVTSWLPDEVARDAHGYVLTGAGRARRPAGGRTTGSRSRSRPPCPGLFAAGDVRSGSVKRVAAGVGEGGMAIAFVHQLLALG